MKVKKICKQCGKEFESIRKRQKYCSKKCSQLAQRKGKELICVYCKKKFYRKPCHVKQYKHHFCSLKCKNDYQKKPLIKVKCKYCNSNIIATRHKRKINKSGKYFCSKFCFYQYNQGTNHKNYNQKKMRCNNCKKQIMVHKYKIDKNNFCSMKCRNEYILIHFKNSALYKYEPWKNYKYLFNIFKGQMFGSGYKPNKLDKKAIKAKILIHKIRRSLNVNK